MYKGPRLTQQELDALLDKLKETPVYTRKDWQWEKSVRYSGEDNPMKRPEVAEKISKSKTGKPRSQYVKDKVRATNKIKHAGRSNGHYGKGDVYRVTTPEGGTFIGTPLDIKEKYGVQPANLREYALRARPCTKGKFKNYLFEIWTEIE